MIKEGQGSRQARGGSRPAAPAPRPVRGPLLTGSSCGSPSSRLHSPPEVLHCVKGVNCAQRLSPGRLLLLAVGVVKPQRPLGLQRVLLAEVGLACARMRRPPGVSAGSRPPSCSPSPRTSSAIRQEEG